MLPVSVLICDTTHTSDFAEECTEADPCDHDDDGKEESIKCEVKKGFLLLSDLLLFFPQHVSLFFHTLDDPISVLDMLVHLFDQDG